jgi:NAD(P)H-quinone oxidoreductase subunit 5
LLLVLAATVSFSLRTHISERVAVQITRLAAGINLAAAALAMVVTIAAGPSHVAIATVGGWGLDLQLDLISVSLFGLVAFVGVIVARFARSYLAGDPRRARFLADLSLTLAAVGLLVVSGNVLQLVLAWIGTSFGLHRLLLGFGERPGVPAAAQRKFVIARAGDVCLIAALAFLVQSFATPELGPLLAAVEASGRAGDAPLAVGIAAGLLVLAACLKSAQFPTHGWLIDIVEVPTPVSALLHAGLINAGGFLLLRFAAVIHASPPAMVLLAVIGAVTALFGSLVMLTQTSVKVSLAYSTVAQMGLMMFQCGLGAFGAALLHLIGHSLYKAHAFASSGSAVELARSRPLALRPGHSRAAIGIGVLAACVGVALATVLGAARVWGMTIADEPALIALASILALGLAHVLVRASVVARATLGGGRARELGLVAATVVVVALCSTIYFGLQRGVAHLLGELVPAAPTLTLGAALGMAAAVLGFAAVTFGQWLPASASANRWSQRAYVHLKHGLYLDHRRAGWTRPPARVGEPAEVQP